MMKFKKVLSFVVVTAMVFALAACSSKETSNNEVTTSPTKEPSKTEATKAPEKEEVVTLKWVTVGNGMPKNYDAWQKKINTYLEDKIGVNVDVEVVSWGDWDNRRSVIVNTNGEYDILFTNLGTYTSDVNLGAFYDISDLVKTASPALSDYVPADYWEASMVNGKIYAVPTYKDSSQTEYFVWDKQLVEKLGIDVTKLNTLDSLTDALTAIKKDTGVASFQLNNNGLDAMTFTYDQMSAGLQLLGVKYNDASGKVVATLEQEDMMNNLKLLHQWYKDGIVNSDAATLPETNTYRPCFVAQGWSKAAITAWGPQMGVDAVAIQWDDTVVSNDTVRGSLNCISSSCKYPEKALQLLELVNTDTYVRDAFYYGLEGDNFDYTADKKIHKNNDEWTMAGYTQGTFFNVTQLDTAEFNQWDEVKELNENAKPSVLLGFTFDTSSVIDELANCTEIYNRYKSEVMTGTVDPTVAVPELMKEVRAAGFDKIVTEAQKQVDEFLKK